MCKKLVFAVALVYGIQALAMNVMMKGTPQDEHKVKIFLEDDQNPKNTHEVEVPVRLAKLIGLIMDDLLGNDPHVKNVGFPLLNVTLQTWRLIEDQLERAYRIIHDVGIADQLRKEIFNAYDTLDSKRLGKVIRAADYLHMPLLLEIACDVIKKGALEKLSFEEIVLLPGDLGNRMIFHKLLMLVGPIPVREQARAEHQDRATSLCITKDGKVVSGSYDNTVRVWDMEGNELAVCTGHESWVGSVCVTEDGKIVSGSYDQTVRVWDMKGIELAVCRGHERQVVSVSLTDGKIVSGSLDRTVRVWDMEGRELAVCRGHDDVVASVCATKDGKIVSGSLDRTVRVWDMEGKELAACRGHESLVQSVCATKDGKIVSGSYDKTVRVWDMQGNALAVCRGHESLVQSVSLTNDGKIVSDSLDSTVRVWDIGLLSHIRYMDEAQAQAVWKLLQRIAQDDGEIDTQKCWQAIERMLIGESLSLSGSSVGTINNKNNIE